MRRFTAGLVAVAVFFLFGISFLFQSARNGTRSKEEENTNDLSAPPANSRTLSNDGCECDCEDCPPGETIVVTKTEYLQLLKPAEPETRKFRANSTGERRKIYINVGANDGTYIDLFFTQEEGYKELRREWDIKSNIDGPWTYIGYELSSQFTDDLKKMQEKYRSLGKDLTIHTETAVWVDNDGVYFSGEDLHGKVSSKGTLFASIDFNEWLEQNIRPDDFLIIKMNIEGAEFPIIEKVLLNGNCKLLDIWYLRYHGYLMSESTYMKGTEDWIRHGKSLTRLLRQCGVEVDLIKPWTMDQEWLLLDEGNGNNEWT